MIKVANWINDALRNHNDEAVLNRIKTEVIELMEKHPYLEG